MHILITDRTGKSRVVKKVDIQRVEEQGTMGTVVRFTNKKVNPAIFVPGTVTEFYYANLITRTK